MPSSARQPTVDEFKVVAQPYLDAVREHFDKEGGLHISDVILPDSTNGERELQFVNLVQEGGGVLGIALVGYTYILEEMGVRFLRLAGTSAGAINTMLMACIKNKEDKKSTYILDILAKKNLFDFVDGHWLTRSIIRMFIRDKSGTKKIMKAILGIVLTVIVLYLLNFYLLGRDPESDFAELVLVGSSVFFLFIIVAVLWIRHLVNRFDRNGYGLNPGNDFTNWITSILCDHNLCPGIKTLKDLDQHLRTVPPIVHREGRDVSDLRNPKAGEEFITLITSDITSQIKVEFPKMWPLYWRRQEDVNPADFVRASMSIPIFFETFEVDNIPTEEVRPHWENMLNLPPGARIPRKALFVDGGVISNFPINIFFNPNLDTPRFPTLGVLLDDADENPRERYTSFLSFIFSIFNTVRAHYDKDFLIKHHDFEKTIGRIDVRGFNWLNFNISADEQLRLFKKGVEAAAEFLLGTEAVMQIPGNTISAKARKRNAFNWPQYRDSRREMVKKLKEEPVADRNELSIL